MSLEDTYQAILCEPLNDKLRMIYADELEEAGEPDRANLIRVQIELAQALEFDGVRIVGDFQMDVKRGEKELVAGTYGADIRVSGMVAEKELHRYASRAGELASERIFTLLFGGYVAKAFCVCRDMPRIQINGFVIAKFQLLPQVIGDNVVWYKPQDDDRCDYLVQREVELLESYYKDEPICVGNAITSLDRGLVGRADFASMDGVVDGIANLCAKYPITKVAVAGAVPESTFYVNHQSIDRWVWNRSVGGRNRESDVPDEIFGEMMMTYQGELYVSFDSEKNAYETLSRTCIAYGRKQAGLPMIK